MKVIFLDVDGVINSDKTFDEQKDKESDISERKVQLLKQIVDMTNAVIVLSSSWRVYWKKEIELKSTQHPNGKELDEFFDKYGLTIYDKTPKINHDRGKEISEWLKSNQGVDNWVVLDDEIFDDFESENILNHLVKTCFYKDGLEELHIPKIIKILNSSEEELKSMKPKECNFYTCKHRDSRACNGFWDC